MKTARKLGVAALLLGLATMAGAQNAAASASTSSSLPDNPSPASSLENAYLGSVRPLPLQSGVMSLTLDEAIRMGIEHNLGLQLARVQQKNIRAERLQTINYLAPNISLHAETGVHQYDLAAEGFHEAEAGEFARLAPAGSNATFPFITKVDVTTAQLNLSQQLFNWAGWDAWRAAGAAVKAADYSANSAYGLVVLNVGDLYLEALAAGTQVDMAQALLRSEAVTLRHSEAEHEAGTVAGLDVLRARVAYQQQRQALLQAQDSFAKAKIALNRAIGLAPEQKISLAQAAPYANLPLMPIDRARLEAYRNRQDYQTLQAEIHTAFYERKAASHQRLPSLSFSGNWGVTGISGGIYHSTFAAMGTLSIPIFQEAKFRGDHDVAQAQLDELRTQMQDLKQKIDEQLRDSMLDVETSAQLMRVAASNLHLANETLTDTTERYVAGVDTNLPVIEAQATVAQAQTRYIRSALQYNEAKLGFARNLGIVDQAFHGVQIAAAR
jgi:outer membrane protein TolC